MNIEDVFDFGDENPEFEIRLYLWWEDQLDIHEIIDDYDFDEDDYDFLDYNYEFSD